MRAVFVGSPGQARLTAPPGASAVAPASRDIHERFTVLVERYRVLKDKNALLKQAYRTKQQELDALVARGRTAEAELRKATESAELAQFNYAKVTKQVAALQVQIKEEREKASQGGWFSSGAKADLERCKVALVAARGELRRKVMPLMRCGGRRWR